MKATKDSPIWQMLSSIFPDSTGLAKPPFAYNSGMGFADEEEISIEEEISDEQIRETMDFL